MKGILVAMGTFRGRKAAARIVDGQLDDLLVDPPKGVAPAVGTIYRAVADRPVKGMGGQFLRLPDGGKAFLRQGQVAPGKSALVQVSGFAEPGKAVPVTTRLLFKGRHAIVTPGAPGLNVSRRIREEHRRAALEALAAEAAPEAAGMILRSAAEHADDAAIAQEIATLAGLATQVAGDGGKAPDCLLDGPDAHEMAWLEWSDAGTVDQDLAASGADAMIDEMLAPRVALKGGALAWIEPTRALIAVDVNTGGDTSPAAGLKANIALSRDLPRQLRCRGLAGQVVIDGAPFPKKDRRVLEQTLRAAFRADPAETALAGWTPLGHFELQRKRDRWPLAAG